VNYAIPSSYRGLTHVPLLVVRGLFPVEPGEDNRRSPRGLIAALLRSHRLRLADRETLRGKSAYTLFAF